MGYGSTITANGAAATKSAERARAVWHERATHLYEDLRRPATVLIHRAYGSAFSESEIEDIYSNAWLGTLRALESKAADLTDEEVRSYVLTAVANHGSKEIRRRKRKPVAPLEAAGSVAEVTDSVHERAEATESRRLTRDLLASLPPRRRTVMLLRYGWELNPGEICGMVDGLSPRAYRKEISKGVDDLVDRIKLVEEGHWCADREPVLKAFAAGTATDDQALQAERHISHCRSCHEFVGKLSGHLHDVGSSILLPGALEAADGHSTLLERVRDTLESARDSAAGAVSRPETSEGLSLAAGSRGAGVTGAGVLAKLSSMGGGAKAALACVGGVAAVSTCIVAGIGPLSPSDSSDSTLDRSGRSTPRLARIADGVRPTEPPQTAGTEAPAQASPRTPDNEADQADESPPDDVLDEETPPETQELGVESAAAPIGTPPPQTAPTSNEGAVAQEFGP